MLFNVSKFQHLRYETSRDDIASYLAPGGQVIECVGQMSEGSRRTHE